MYPRQKIRNKWLVAYTLLRNPSLQSLTGNNLKGKAPTKQNESVKDEDLSSLVENALIPVTVVDW